MTYLRLRPHISFAIIDDQPIFLDLRRDLYFALDGAAAKSFAIFRCNPDRLPGDEFGESLLATGLFAVSREPGNLRPAEIESPDRDLLEDGAKPGLSDLIRVLFVLIGPRGAVRRQPLERVIARRRRSSAICFGSLPAAATLALAQRFLRARALIPIKPVCLQDSLALHDWLAAHGAHPSLVLGVRLDPFAAHCWVQLGETVLNDASDRVIAYTPILVVE